MKHLNYYLSLAEKGNADAAFEAAKIMFDDKCHDFIVQSMLRKAAMLGNVKAQCWLGFLCLDNRLIDSTSTFSEIKYVEDYSVAFDWFKKAACCEDTLAMFALYKCLQLGIGVEKSPEKADVILNSIAQDLSYDMLPLMLFFDTLRKSIPPVRSVEYKTIIRELLAS